MSIQATYVGSIEASETTALADTDENTVVAGEDALLIVAAVNMINTSGSAVVVSLYRNDGATSHRYWRGSIPANSTVACETPVTLAKTGEAMKAQAATSNVIEVFPVVLRQGRFG